jgi:predicted MFS family arabinose efflux permease
VKGALLALACGTFAVGTDSFVVAGVLPEVAHDLDVAPSTAGQLVTVYAFVYALLSPLLAAVATRWTHRQLLLTGLAVFVCGNVLMVIVPEFGLTIAARVLTAVGAAMFSPMAVATSVLLVEPARRARAIATVTGGLSAATALGAPIGVAVSAAGGWRASFALVAGLGTAAATAVACFVPGTTRVAAGTLTQRLSPLADRSVGLALLTTLLVFTGLYTVYTYISFSFDRVTGHDPGRLALLLALWGCSASAGTFIAGTLVDRLGHRVVLNLAITMAAADFALLPISSAQVGTAAVALVVWGVTGWAIVVAQVDRLMSLAPARGPLIAALNASALYFGVSLSGLVGGTGIQLVGPHGLGALGAVLIAAGLPLSEWAYPRRVRPALEARNP